MEFKFKLGQNVNTQSREIGIVEKCKVDVFGNSYLIKVGDEVKWINENHLTESNNTNEEYLTEGWWWERILIDKNK